jgi:hypothetical protein
MVPEFELSDDGLWLDVEFDARAGELPGLRMRADGAAMRHFAAELRREVAAFPSRPVEEHGQAHQRALSFRALEGTVLAAMSARMPAEAAPLLSDPQTGRTLANFAFRAPQAVRSFGGATVPGWHSPIEYQPADPSAPRYTGRFRPMPRLAPGANGIEIDYPDRDRKLLAMPAEMRAIFPSATDAFCSAKKLIRDGVDAGVRLQVGVDLGIVVEVEDDDLGGVLVRASEIALVCEPGSILASEAARRSADESAELTYREHGAIDVASASEPVRLFEVRT